MYKLLIAEDEPLIRRGIKQLIDLENLKISEIFEASNGKEALDIYLEHKPEIILMDINMPHIDGLSLSSKIKGINDLTKIAIITGYDYFEYAQSAIKIGVNDYILKPISKDDVSQIILKLVNILDEENKKSKLEEVIENINIEEIAIENEYKSKILNIFDREYTNINFSLTLLADELNLSNGYLSNLFKKNFGISFQDFLLQKRMEKAKILLLTTNLKNYQIAENIGIEDVNYFISKFKKYYGISPKQYKERIIHDKKN